MNRIACLLLAAAGLTAADPVTFRVNGLGHVPDAQPPTTWDLAAGTNVRWQVAMPSASNTGPLVVEGRVVTVANPEQVLCYDANDGKLLWQASAPAAEGVPAADRAEAAEAFAAGWKVMEEYLATPFKQRGKDLKAAMDRYWSNGKGILNKRWGMTGPNDFGWGMPSPIWDGERIIVRFETGSVAAFALDGTRRWLTQVPNAGGHETPLAIDGAVVFTRRGGKDGYDLVALDAKTGAQRWVSAEPCRNPHDGFGGGGPTWASLGGRNLIVCHGGEIVDPATGKVLARCAVEGNCRASTPIVVGEVVYFPAQPDHGHGVSGVEAFRLAVEGSTVSATALWRTEPTGKETMTSPLWTGKHLVMVYAATPYLWTYDPANGALLNGDDKVKASLRMSGHAPSPNPALVGGKIWAFDGSGSVLVAEPGPQPKIVAALQLEGMGASPAFVGDRIYARTHQRLICIGK